MARLFAFYDACSKRGWHAAVILIAACAILFLRWGDVFSVILGLIAYTGCAALIFDAPLRRDLVDPRRLGLATALIGAFSRNDLPARPRRFGFWPWGRPPAPWRSPHTTSSKDVF